MTRCRDAALVTSVAAMLAIATGCNSNNNNNNQNQNDGGTVADGGTTTDGGTTSDGGTTADGGIGVNADGGTPTTATASTNDPTQNIFFLAQDAAPSPDGATIYFVSGSGNGGAVFKTSATAGSTATLVSDQPPIGAPLGIAVSSDGTKLYLADPAALTTTDKGAILVEPVAGGTATLLAETVDFAPRAVTVAKVGGTDEIVFIGTNKTANAAGTFDDGVFKDASGTVTSVVSGGNPAAVAAATDGTIYILDQSGAITKVAPGATTATALPASTTATKSINASSGMDLSLDQTALLVTGFDPAGKEAVFRVSIASGAITQLTLAPVLVGAEPAGLHRALNSDTFAFVDSGANTSGTIYLLK
jgi:hypothetical protein